MKKVIRELGKKAQKGRFGLDILMWLFGVPLPFIILFSVLRGCR